MRNKFKEYMEKLFVRNFGPIRSTEISIKEFTLFIGPQASGKSTLAKLIYYFLSLKDDVTQYVFAAVANRQKIEFNSVELDLKIQMCRKFVQLFGTTKHLQAFEIRYEYADGLWVRLFLDNRHTVKMDFSELLSEQLHRKVVYDANGFIMRQQRLGTSYVAQQDMLMSGLEQRKFMAGITSEINALFGGDERSALYVPACRSLLATLSDYIYPLINASLEEQKIPDSILDYASKAFIDRMIRIRAIFSQSLDDIIRDARELSPAILPPEEVLEQAKGLIDRILRGAYRYEAGEERIYYKEDEYVKLSLSSSGQQEAVWILQQLFWLVLNNSKTTLLIEEPESHIFPQAQKDMMELVALFANLNNNRVVITTHSPYILTSANNLIYAHVIGQKRPEEVKKIVSLYSWLDYDKVGVYFVDKGESELILNEETRQIKVERIDEVSGVLNEEYERLFDLEED